jgi:hypothetical protein
MEDPFEDLKIIFSLILVKYNKETDEQIGCFLTKNNDLFEFDGNKFTIQKRIA